MKVFSHCELDHFDGCVGCTATGGPDCGAVFVDLPDRCTSWTHDWDWRSWLFGAVKVDAILVVHIGPLCLMRLKV